MQIDNFEKFWLHYLHQQRRAATRDLHILGTGAALVLLGAGLASLAVEPRHRPIPVPALLGAAAAAGYGPAWFAHFFVEGNRPASFAKPVWSLLADLRMTWLWATGRLDQELHVAGVLNDKDDAAHLLASKPRTG